MPDQVGKFRPASEPRLKSTSNPGDIFLRANMEASENRGMPLKGGGGAGLHRIDPDVVAEILGAADRASGFSRVELVLNSVIGRALAVGGGPRPRENKGKTRTRPGVVTTALCGGRRSAGVGGRGRPM